MDLRLIGYWKGNYAKNYPDPTTMVDPEWDKEIKEKVIQHLESGVLHNQQRGWSSCRFCGKSNGSRELTDGKFLWPEGLVHYLKDHQVRLPRLFVQHCLTYAFDKKAVEKELEDWWEKGLGLGNIREDWWKSYIYRDYQGIINWSVEPDVEDDEMDVLVALGFWKGDSFLYGGKGYPNPEPFMDKNWNENTRKQVINYMKTCTVLTSEEEVLKCRDKCLFTGQQLSSRILCDGRYMFPENYIHYIESHQVRPLDCFTKRALSHQNTWKDDSATVDYLVEIDWWESFQLLE